MEDEVEMDGLADDCRDYQIIVQLHKQAGRGPPISHSSIFNWFLRQVSKLPLVLQMGLDKHANMVATSRRPTFASSYFLIFSCGATL